MATAQNTRISIGDTTIAANIKPDLVNELREYSKAARRPVSQVLNEAIQDFMDQVEWAYTTDASGRFTCHAELKPRRAKIRAASTARGTTARAAETEMRPAITTNTETPFAASDEQFAADVVAKALTGELLAAGQPFMDEYDDDDVICMMRGLIAMYEDHERSQQPQVDAAIQYLFEPPASA
jgi:hypothetical protein